MEKFSNLVVESVVNSKWFYDAKHYIMNNEINKKFYLITSTPKIEIDNILERINFFHYFENVYGWPSKKNEVIQQLINENSYDKDKCVMIGDSKTDYSASMQNNIDFLLHLTNENKKQFIDYRGHFYI